SCWHSCSSAWRSASPTSTRVSTRTRRLGSASTSASSRRSGTGRARAWATSPTGSSSCRRWAPSSRCSATAINRVVTVAKVLPIVAFVLLAVFLLDPQVLAENFRGYGITGPLFEQVRGTMLATVFVFLGVEGASVYSRHARRREDVGRATVLGFLMVLSIFASVTIVSYGILPMEELAQLRQPSMAGVLEAAVGGWGAVFVSAG